MVGRVEKKKERREAVEREELGRAETWLWTRWEVVVEVEERATEEKALREVAEREWEGVEAAAEEAEAGRAEEGSAEALVAGMWLTKPERWLKSIWEGKGKGGGSRGD